MSFFRFEFRFHEIYYDFLGILSDIDGKFYYCSISIEIFLGCITFRKNVWPRHVIINPENIGFDRLLIEHEELLKVLWDLDTEQSLFLLNFLENGYVRPLFGHWFNEHRIQMCDGGQTFVEWLKDFEANYGPCANHQMYDGWVKEEDFFSTLPC